jgi:acetylornithine deacetylase/succinyl-diaminopimelate desuccinylase-like protein
VVTQVAAGHAPNALPQRAEANVNCRIFPGVPVETVQAKLVELAADPKVTVTADETTRLTPPPPPLTPAIMKPLRVQADKLWPGVPIVPFQATGATDGKYLNSYGIPTYGLTGIFADGGNSGAHGLNERIRVKSVYEARDFLYGLVKAYASAK